MRHKRVIFLVQAAAIAAIYVVITLLFAPFGFGEIQVRLAEALTILPYYTPAAIPGLFIGCLIGNLMGGAILPDIIFGSLATLLAAGGSYLLKGQKYLVPLPPVLANTVIVPFILFYGYGINLPIPLMMLTVGIGEFISCWLLGSVLLAALTKYRNILFRSHM